MALSQLIDDDFGVTFELFLFACTIKKKVCALLDYFLSFLRRCEKTFHNMLLLMLDPQFKSLHLLIMNTTFQLLKIMTKKSLHLMFLKCYHHLHLVSNCVEIESTNQKVDEDCNLDIFKMIVSTSEQVKELINKKLLIFWRFQAYV